MAEHISVPVCHIFNCSLRNGIFPQVWRAAKVISIIKNNKNAFNGSNCRPISILPVLSKILERIVFDQILTYFITNRLDSIYQHAYKTGHSTATALSQMTEEWLSHLDNRKIIGAVLIDFSAAFDVIDQKLLLAKLCAYGFNINAMGWVKSYLHSRMQCVYFNGNFSSLKHLECGIPQRSCLGPLLFSIFTNDLPLALNRATMTMYADESTVHAAVDSYSELNSLLQKELDSVSEWIESNRLALNITKIKLLPSALTPCLGGIIISPYTSRTQLLSKLIKSNSCSSLRHESTLLLVESMIIWEKLQNAVSCLLSRSS